MLYFNTNVGATLGRRLKRFSSGRRQKEPPDHHPRQWYRVHVTAVHEKGVPTWMISVASYHLIFPNVAIEKVDDTVCLSCQMGFVGH